jgi:glycerol-3-phosphate dehydrogenase
VRDHAADGAAGAITITGVKYTTARATAERAIDAATRSLGKPRARCRTESSILPGAGISDHEALAIETARGYRLQLSRDTIRHLTSHYGERCAGVIALMGSARSLAEPVAAGTPVVAAEVAHAVRGEMACRLVDVVARRTSLGALGYPGDEAVRRCAEIMREEIGWSAAQADAEIEHVREFYQVPTTV